ncbi:hypothetical protein VPH35_012668 [Triticum aestivum]
MQSQETSDSMVMSTQPSPTSRSSPTKVRAMVDSLDAFKKSLVEEMEFGVILHVPIISKTNLKLSIWLMSGVNEVSRTIYIRPGRQMSFRASDVHKVFGVPIGRLHIQRASALDITHVRDFLQIRQHGKNLLTAVQKIISRPLDKDSSDSEINSFKMAFVTFVVGHLLAPSPSHDRTNTQYWGAIAQVDHVAEFNWCEYMLEELMAACLRVKADIRAGRDVTYLHACHLFLQIIFLCRRFFYLDNLDLGLLNLPHNIFPRISAFDETQYGYNAAWDIIKGLQTSPEQCTFQYFLCANQQIRSADQVCYARSAWDTPPDPVPCNNSMFPGRLASFNNATPGSSRPHVGPLVSNAQPISFRPPHGVPPSIANSLKADLFAENTAFLNALVSELGEGCICCSLRTLPCIINNPANPESPRCTNIYRRKLDMTESDGFCHFSFHRPRDHQRRACRFSHASPIQEPDHLPIASRRTERVVGRAGRFDYDAGRREQKIARKPSSHVIVVVHLRLLH